MNTGLRRVPFALVLLMLSACLVARWSLLQSRIAVNIGSLKLNQVLSTEQPSAEVTGLEDSISFLRKATTIADGDRSHFGALGIALFMHGRKNEARAVWKETQVPVGNIFANWGDRSAAEGRLDEAQVWYGIATDVDPSLARAWHAIGILNQESGHENDARSALNKAWLLGSIDSVSPYAWILFAAKDYEAASDVWHQALLQNLDHPQRLEWWRGLLGSMRANKKWETLLSLVPSALAEFPYQASLYVDLGIAIYNQSGDLDASAEALQTAIAIDPSQAAAYGEMGHLLAAEERFEEAYAWYSKAIARDHDNRNWYMIRADLVRRSSDIGLALALYEEVTMRFPDYARSYYEIAWIHWTTEHPENAIMAITHAMELADPPQPRIFLRAGMIFEWTGNLKKAATAFRKALAQDPTIDRARQGLLRVEESIRNQESSR